MSNINCSIGVNNSYGVNSSHGVNCSDGVNFSHGVNCSDGVNLSNGVNYSNGVNCSNGVNNSYGVNSSNGVNYSTGVNFSHGVNCSDGVNHSYGVFNSFGVDKAIFLADKERSCSIFGKEVSEKRFNQVWKKLRLKLGDWFPKFNNAFELYLKNGSSWKKVDASSITQTIDKWEKPYEAWKDMPKEAIQYVKSLPEFDAKIFKRITGIDVETNDCVHNDTYNFCPNCGIELLNEKYE